MPEGSLARVRSVCARRRKASESVPSPIPARQGGEWAAQRGTHLI
jgi:hypothetical protein